MFDVVLFSTMIVISAFAVGLSLAGLVVDAYHKHLNGKSLGTPRDAIFLVILMFLSSGVCCASFLGIGKVFKQQVIEEVNQQLYNNHATITRRSPGLQNSSVRFANFDPAFDRIPESRRD